MYRQEFRWVLDERSAISPAFIICRFVSRLCIVSLHKNPSFRIIHLQIAFLVSTTTAIRHMHAKFKTLDATARQSNAPKSKLSKQSKTHNFYTPNPMRVSSLFVSHCISIPYPASYEETFQT